MTIYDDTVYCQALTRPHAQGLVKPDLFDRDILLDTIAYHAGSFRLQPNQALNRFRGFTPCAHFQRGTEIDQRDDNSRRFEVSVLRHRRHQHRVSHYYHRIQPRGTGTQCNQGVHIGIMIFCRFPRTGEKMTPGVDQYP